MDNLTYWQIVLFFVATFIGSVLGTSFGLCLYRRFGRKKKELDDFRRAIPNLDWLLAPFDSVFCVLNGSGISTMKSGAVASFLLLMDDYLRSNDGKAV